MALITECKDINLSLFFNVKPETSLFPSFQFSNWQRDDVADDDTKIAKRAFEHIFTHTRQHCDTYWPHF